MDGFLSLVVVGTLVALVPLVIAEEYVDRKKTRADYWNEEFGPQHWWEYPIFWAVAVHFKIELYWWRARCWFVRKVDALADWMEHGNKEK